MPLARRLLSTSLRAFELSSKQALKWSCSVLATRRSSLGVEAVKAGHEERVSALPALQFGLGEFELFLVYLQSIPVQL